MNTPPTTTTPTTPDWMPLVEALHGLYHDAQALDGPAFEAALFARLGGQIAFDAAWLGHSTLTGQGAEMHSSTLFGLPAAFLSDWAQVQDGDPLLQWAQSDPRHPACLCIGDANLAPGFRSFLARHGVAQVLCATTRDTALNTCLHISLYRHTLKPSFEATDQSRLQAMVLNVAAAVALNRMRDVERAAHGGQAPDLGVALISRQGVVQMANPRFAPWMRKEWPNWPGGCLPADVPLGVAVGQSKRFLGQRLELELQPRGDLLMVTLRPLSPSSCLTARERAVAWHFAQGQTYKTVAKALGLAPATVRHHLRNVYRKLGINDKGAISRALGQAQVGEATPPPP